MPAPIEFEVNGRPVKLEVDGDRRLLWVLRTELGLTGTKYGCGKMECGACTVLLDGKAVRSCGIRMRAVEGRKVTTIEGLADGDTLHPLQEAFARHGALQCGFCTPGMIMAAVYFLERNPRPTREQVVDGLDRSLCRCGAHTRILDAILDAAASMEGSQR